ncbi:hypothetical protein AAC387_Pa03g2588 [Persea americana]
MPQASTSSSSAYLTPLTQEIEKKLQRALASPSQRLNLLQELFADIALEVDIRARGIILNEDEGIVASEGDGNESCLCFYDVLADHYVRMPENGKPILDLIVQLWSQSFVSHIFALLFHKWLFEVPLENSEALLRYASALVQGASNIFWTGVLHYFLLLSLHEIYCGLVIKCNFEAFVLHQFGRIDIQTNKRRFFSLFRYLLEEVALVPTRLNKTSVQAQRDLCLQLSRFIFFYDLADKLESFLKQFPVFPNAFLVGGPEDIFVIELTDQLQRLKVEPVLLHYLSQMRCLQGLELRMATSTRLKACLYSFTSPGGPMYPTRAVRHAAWDALDLLFPVGRYPRHLISLFFRLLYPWYWPSSCWNFIISCIRALLYSILRFIFSTWESLRRPKNP